MAAGDGVLGVWQLLKWTPEGRKTNVGQGSEVPSSSPVFVLGCPGRDSWVCLTHGSSYQRSSSGCLDNLGQEPGKSLNSALENVI